MVAPPTLAYQETVSLVPPSPAPKSAKMKSTNRAIITHRIQLKYFTFSRRTLSIQRLLSLRAARRRREQHFTSRRPGRTTAAPGSRVLARLPLPPFLPLGEGPSLEGGGVGLRTLAQREEGTRGQSSTLGHYPAVGRAAVP